ncbi:MAG TPA: protein kinase [Thermoanaerobaculia bacterium]|nr:protein kinase [Thermoanaerobaculia bacterium]
MSTSPGSLEGKYEVLAKIREGGMGAIYKVRHRLLNELRVIKVMRPEVAQSSEQRKRFLREAQTATRLRHTNIVAFHDFFIDEEDTAYMVMEYIEGINLRDMVREFGPFPVSLALDVSRQCLSAFDYLHRKGVVHRDVSPDNVMLSREDDGVVRAKLIDLGIAKIAQAKEELTGADEFIGKLRYSSPEQLTSSAQIDARSDLFSFGIVLYEILTGTRPYGGETIHEIVANRLNQPPLPFDETDPSGRLSPELRETILKSLRTKAAERYQTAAEFGKALESLGGADADPESAARVAGYTDGAMALAQKAAAQAEVVGGDLNAPVKDLFRTGGSRPSQSDVKFRTSIARWADATPEASPGDAKTLQLSSEDPTVMPALPHDWSTARTRPVTGPTEAQPQHFAPAARKSPMPGYLGAAVVAALLVGFGFWIAGRERREARAVLDPPAAGGASSIEPTAPPAPTAPAGEPARSTDVKTDPEPVKPAPPPEQKPPGATADAPPTPRTAERPRPTAAPRVAVVRPTSAPRAASAEAETERQAAVPAVRTGPKMSYCPQLDDTVFKQGVVRDVPTGFGDIATKAPRPDSGLMRMNISLSAERPLDDQSFFVVVRFENGGDSKVDVQRLEESASRGGLRAVSGAAVPVSVSPGGMKELHRYPLSLSGGEPYSKQFVAIDSKGDSWKTGIRIVPCAD